MDRESALGHHLTERRSSRLRPSRASCPLPLHRPKEALPSHRSRGASKRSSRKPSAKVQVVPPHDRSGTQLGRRQEARPARRQENEPRRDSRLFRSLGRLHQEVETNLSRARQTLLLPTALLRERCPPKEFRSSAQKHF